MEKRGWPDEHPAERSKTTTGPRSTCPQRPDCENNRATTQHSKPIPTGELPPKAGSEWLWAETGTPVAAGAPVSLNRRSGMNLTSHQYQRSAWRNGFESGLTFRVSLEAWESATTEDHTNGKQFDNNVTAAIQAGEWLDRAVMSYRG